MITFAEILNEMDSADTPEKYYLLEKTEEDADSFFPQEVDIHFFISDYKYDVLCVYLLEVNEEKFLKTFEEIRSSKIFQEYDGVASIVENTMTTLGARLIGNR